MAIPAAMHAVLLTRFGGPDALEYRTDVAVPSPGPNEVLIRVGAAGVNNTDINTRTGWYSKSVRDGTGSEERDADVDADGGWSGALDFPRIQGADAAGTIVAVGDGVEADRVGQRVIARSMQAPVDPAADPELDCITMGSEIDGAFAQYVVVRSSEAYRIDSDLSDVELASFPCASSTAEGMLARAEVGAGDRVLVTGASGGVGSARRRSPPPRNGLQRRTSSASSSSSRRPDRARQTVSGTVTGCWSSQERRQKREVRSP